MKYYALVLPNSIPICLQEMLQKFTVEMQEKGYVLRSTFTDAERIISSKVKENRVIRYLPCKEVAHWSITEPRYIDIEKQYDKKKFPESINNYRIRDTHYCLRTNLLKRLTRVIQLLGSKLDDKVDFFICYSNDKHSIKEKKLVKEIAKKEGIPVFDLNEVKDYTNPREFIRLGG